MDFINNTEELSELEIKRLEAEQLFKQGHTTASVSKMLSVNAYTVADWRLIYQVKKSNGKNLLLNKSFFNREELIQLVKNLLNKGLGYRRISSIYGLDLWFCRDVMRQWRKLQKPVIAKEVSDD